MSQKQYRAFGVPWFSPTKEDLEHVLSDVKDYWELPVSWEHLTIPHPAWGKLQNSNKMDIDYTVCTNDLANFMMSLATQSLEAAYNDGKTLDEETDLSGFLDGFQTIYKEVILNELSKERDAKSSWLVMRLVRTASKMARSECII